MILRWLPWKYVIRRAAHAHGFLDPLSILGRLGNFAQPSEVTEPVELLRAGLVFHARGLINTRAIQNNLDWVWPYWVERQFNPRDPSFIPRGFSFSHINLSHRNWTAVGVPDCPFLPLVDPTGLVTPFIDGWSLDGWILREDGTRLLPSKLKENKEIHQNLILEPDGFAVETQVKKGDMTLKSRVEVILNDGEPYCIIRYEAKSRKPGWVAVSLRPYNPEGVSFVKSVHFHPGQAIWTINGEPCVRFVEPVESHAVSEYRQGDVLSQLPHPSPNLYQTQCKVEMATAAALFPLDDKGRGVVTVQVKLHKDKETLDRFGKKYKAVPWQKALAETCSLSVPDTRFQNLFDIAVRSLLLHSPGEVFPGPYTYKRFWFRDAAFMLDALLAVNLPDRVRRTLEIFPEKQTVMGYFLSQEGEWDSNGEAIWIINRYCEVTRSSAPEHLLNAVRRGAEWICRKRIRGGKDERVEGLFPAGFSAEHLGPNDFYYWDDFWGVAGLRAAAALFDRDGYAQEAERFRREADDFQQAIDRSIALTQKEGGLGRAVPAAPRRRMDSGAVGSLAASYPLKLYPLADERMLETALYLRKHHSVRGAFFQDMIHSGINAYLTLHIAQVLLRAGDAGHFELVEKVVDLASPTGQWPEAIHPHTLGGCMGDGHHAWASAEWVLMIRSLFLIEEEDSLILCAGIPRKWLDQGSPLRFGPTPTRFGTVTVHVRPEKGRVKVAWEADWKGPQPRIEVRLEGAETAERPAKGIAAVAIDRV